MPAFIIGSGTSIPDRVVSNEEIAPSLGLDPEQIFKSSGILRRRWADAGTTTSALASVALQTAITDAGVLPEEIDYLIFGTMTPDRLIPGSAPTVQRTLGLGQIPCLDIRQACCNPLYALQIATALIGANLASRVAICLAEIQSAWLDMSPESGTTSMLFGDGASALIVSGDTSSHSLEVIDIALATDGSYVDDLGVRGPGTEFGTAASGNENSKPRMVGQSVILNASRKIMAACQDVLKRNSLQVADIRWLVPHQANANLLAQIARGLHFPVENGGLISVLEDLGNTSSASMGIALDSLRRSARISPGDYLLLPAFGAGFSWGAGLCRATS